MNPEAFGWLFLRKNLDVFGADLTQKHNDMGKTWKPEPENLKFTITDGVFGEVVNLNQFGGGATGSSSMISESDMDFIAEVMIHSVTNHTPISISHTVATKAAADAVGATEDMVNTDPVTDRAIIHLDSNTEVSLMTNHVSLKYQPGWRNTTKAFRLKEEVLAKKNNLPPSQQRILEEITSFLKIRKLFKSETVPGYKLEMLVLVVMLSSPTDQSHYGILGELKTFVEKMMNMACQCDRIISLDETLEKITIHEAEAIQRILKDDNAKETEDEKKNIKSLMERLIEEDDLYIGRSNRGQELDRKLLQDIVQVGFYIPPFIYNDSPTVPHWTQRSGHRHLPGHARTEGGQGKSIQEEED